ncbi:Signal transduction histidine kinase [Parasphingorhabdus marina DSM 22363]|uniref:histidine kinase n=1 Tax=Parasphingorhabdus marina DSM 22363 TaxID=1123272 RepID=A0A1N6FZW3_9SPHN|nr:HAMP domain-containing sensor histidine kinase [Parasphingorhabdus marina]SIO00777.1 Signal transduction histidine kinase [Parasphingorhabdus marina DSM 22363]
MTAKGNLAEPVRAELGADGRLLSADAPLIRLNRQCGGIDGGQLAIPQLADLVRLSKRLGMNLSRSAVAANEESTIEMWVKTRIPGMNGPGSVGIEITEWQESEAPAEDSFSLQRQRDLDRLNGRGSVRTDASLRIMSIFLPGRPEIAAGMVGQMLWECFETLPGGQGTGVADAIEERQPIRNQLMQRTGQASEKYAFSGQPLIDGGGIFSGYQFSLEREAATEAEAADGAKDRAGLIGDSLFGQQLAPALRQPLDKIIANAETISNQLVGPLRGNYSDYANDIAAAGRHLLSLVDDLSDLEAIEKANFTVAADDIDLVDLAHRTAGLLAVKSADHQIRIDVPPEEREAPAKGEFRRVLQILVNLVGNAIRYSPDGSVIKMQVRQDADTISLLVTDQGDGIAPEDQAKIFEKFERLGRSGDGGSGLGLFISRRLAEAMDGSLTVESQVGKGTTFTLTLPARQK